MIIVEVFVSAVDKSYDFKLNENVPSVLLAEEICEMVCRKEQCRIQGNTEDLLLCCINSKQVIPSEKSLSDMNIHTGEKLVLI
ncbi:MAG: hypothetical protein ACI4I9_07955 [Porcipelethomonas sp.]